MENSKKRRKSVNKTGISRIRVAKSHQAYVMYRCIKCGTINFVPIDHLFNTNEAYESQQWTCEQCNYIHAKDSALPEWEHWNKEVRENPLSVERFWKAFFRNATEKPSSYWKVCPSCGRILPFSDFSGHHGWGLLERQMECRACKAVINAIGNPKRTKDQLHESSVGRRLGDLLSMALPKDKANVREVFERFEGKCFKTGKELDYNDRKGWAIDHILPAKYFYPLTNENAALLSTEANSNKRDQWPSKFYTPEELVRLSEITGADLNLISSETPIYNENIDVNKAIERYLNVRNSSSLNKRINELKKLLIDNDLIERISPENKKRLGL